MSIPEDSTCFVVISESGCYGCIAKSVSAMKDNPRAIFLVNDNSYNYYLGPQGIGRDKCLIDTTGTLQRLKFHHYNVGIVQTAGHKIYNATHVVYSKADSILAALR